MISSPKISIIVCTYNQEQYIGQTLKSLIHQDFDLGYEILVGDDCSTDNTRQVIQSYIDQYPNLIIPVYPEHNLGASKNIVNLINHARGEILSVCDGDDYWVTNQMLKKQWQVFKDEKIGMFCAKAKCFIQKEQQYRGSLGFSGAEDLLTMLETSRDVAAPTIAFRTELMKKCIAESRWYIDNNYFYDSIHAYWFAYNSQVKFIDEELAAYRVLPNSACHAETYEKNALYARRYYSVKWRFILEHDLPVEFTHALLMKEYAALQQESRHFGEDKVRQSKSYKLGATILKPFKKTKQL